ncbi:MAG: ABC transporter substrate-binding protein [Solirubrobacterales bacterium]
MEFSTIRSRIGASLISAAVFLLVFTSATEAKRPNVSKDLITPGTLLIGSDIPYPPFEFGPKSNYKGFDIDLANAMAKKLRLKVVYKDTYFDTIFTDLSQGKFDLVASATTITSERKRVVKFTRANYDAQQSLTVRPDSNIRAVRDLAGLRVGVQNGTTGDYFAEDRTRAGKVLGYPNAPSVIKALKEGRVDAVILDQYVVYHALRKGQRGFKVARNVSTGEKYGFPVRKSSKRLHRGINWAFGKIRADGKFKRIYRKWFGINPPPSLRR